MALTEGQVFKNYNEFCKSLNEPVKSGRSKASQFKYWQECFLWEKQGHKFIITKVIKPLDTRNHLTKHGKWYRGCAIQLLNKVIESTIVNKDKGELGYNELICTANEGYQILGLCNGSFGKLKTQENTLGICEEHRFEFHGAVSEKFYSILTDLLKSLATQKILEWDRTFRFTYGTDTEVIIANIEQRTTIQAVINKVLKEYKYKNEYQVLINGKTKPFYERVNVLLAEIDIFNCWKVYQIGFANNCIERFIGYVNTLQDITSARIDINNKSISEVQRIVDRLVQSCEHGNDMDKMLEHTIPITT